MALILKRLFSFWALTIGAGAIIRFALFRPWEIGITEWGWVENALLFIGMGLLFTGFRYLRSVYTHIPGIRINPRWVTILNDAIALIFSTGAALMAIDFILQKYLGYPSFIDDEFLQFMGIFFLVTGVPLLAFYISRLTSQSIEIYDKGIIFYNLNDHTHIEWDQIKQMSLSDEYVMVGRVGTLIPRQLQKRLKITTTMGYVYYINEPQLRRKKKEVVNLIKDQSPTARRQEFSKVLEEW